ncbi:unnamed protein product [Caenorhabditis angaria]|uniref:F-box domain-containing protein n=1 Tax=Caenorhabditis angaria TaxID=860376 RepID=A0A9P1NAQ3_9PELO|nr:unnamed protein product [Caenorhabditis angaria]
MDLDNIHHTHCSYCINSSCENEICIIEKCQFCHIRLHHCKIEEHVAEICRKVTVKCLNNQFGCDKLLCRDKMSCHLEICPASIVVCTRDRSRRCCIQSSKLELKKLGKQYKLNEFHENMDFDIKLATQDQNSIIKSYHSSRKMRVKQRDPLNPAHPLIPLREDLFDCSVIGREDEDSSEDEKRERRERIKKSRMMFANCYMCQIDPSVQHLHTLGNGSELERHRKRRITVQSTDPFHQMHKLHVSIAVENIPESTIKGENVREIKKGGTIYTIKCLESVKRKEYGQHALSQHTETVDQVDQLILRCPNWYKGCEFHSSRIKPKHGKILLQVENSLITHQVENAHLPFVAKTSELRLDSLPLWVYEELSDYLPSTSLLNLSMVSKNLRQNMFVGLKNRAYVEGSWHKSEKNGNWSYGSFKWKFCKSEPSIPMESNIPSDLSQHISTCEFYEQIEHTEQMVPIFPRELETRIWHGFCDFLSTQAIRDAVFEFE